jgi:hypothetical protein
MRRKLFFSCVGSVLASAALGACMPAAEGGECDNDEQCSGRGQVCEPISHMCSNEQGDHASIEMDAPSEFTDKLVPFFRGRVCVPRNGESSHEHPVPLTFQPCLHSCMSPGAAFYNLQWTCSGAACTAISLFWNEMDGAGCPPDAFSKFPEDECDYSNSFSGNVAENDPYSIGPMSIDEDLIEATVAMEIPFLTTQDLEEIDASSAGNASADCQDDCAGDSDTEGCLKRCKIKEKVEQYKQESDRVIVLDLRNSYPAPPEWCGDFEAPGPDLSACTCYDIGFED